MSRALALVVVCACSAAAPVTPVAPTNRVDAPRDVELELKTPSALALGHPRRCEPAGHVVTAHWDQVTRYLSTALFVADPPKLVVAYDLTDLLDGRHALDGATPSLAVDLRSVRGVAIARRGNSWHYYCLDVVRRDSAIRIVVDHIGDLTVWTSP